MKYYKAEFIIECHEDIKQTARELMAALAGEVGFESFEDTDSGIDGYIQMDFFHKEQLDSVIEEMPLENVSVSYVISAVLDENWNAEWEAAGFEPIDIDERILVYDARKPAPAIDRPIEIGIEARNAFGTGTHETTQMILSQLVSDDLTEARVLDCGCGTGILGIAASKLGAEEIICYDIDEWSVKNTAHNAELNGVQNLHVMEGDASVLSHISGVFDIVMANINRNTLLADMPHFKDVMNIGATLIISGFYTEDAESLVIKAGELGLSEVTRKISNNWCLLVFK